MGFFGGGGSKSKFVVKEFPGIFDDPSATTAAGFGRQLEGETNKQINAPSFDLFGGRFEDGVPSIDFDSLASGINDTQVGKGELNAPSQSFINDLISQVQGANTQRGFLTPATQATNLQAIIPKLTEFDQLNKQNNLSVAQLASGDRGQTIAGRLGEEGQELNKFNSIIASLQALINESAPIRVGGQEQKTEGPSIFSQILDGLQVAATAGSFSNFGSGLPKLSPNEFLGGA